MRAGRFFCASILALLTGPSAFADGMSAIFLRVSPNPAVFGHPVILSVSLSFFSTVAGTPDPTGTVTIYDGVSVLARTASGQSPTTILLSAGIHQLHASYSGDANYSGSTSPNLQLRVASIGQTGF